MKTLRDTAQTGTVIQNWIEVRRCDIDSDHAARVAGNGEYDGFCELLPEDAPPQSVLPAMAAQPDCGYCSLLV